MCLRCVRLAIRLHWLVYLAFSGQTVVETFVSVKDLGRVPANIVLSCEQATGDGGHETFFDADWEFFSDCIHDELLRRKLR